MSKQNTQVSSLSISTTNKNEINANRDLVKKYIFHWPLFVTTIIIASVGAYFYLKRTNPVFPILATLEFKAPTASSASLTVNQSSTQQELDPIDKPIIVENEIEVMQSKKLIYQVVDALQLWVSYQQKKGLTTKDLYKQSPVNFKFIHQQGTLSPKGEKLIIFIKDRNYFLYTDETKKVTKVKYSTPFKSSFGTWELEPTADLENYIGTSITIGIQDPDLATDAYQSGVKVVLENKDAPFVNLSTSDQVPQRGKDVLNSLMQLYIQFAIEDKTKLSQKTLKFIESRLDSLKIQLDSVERQIQRYKNTHSITDLALQAQGFREINKDNLRAMNDVDIQLGVVNGLEKYSNSNSEKLPPVSGLITEPGLSVLYEKLAELQLQRDQLAATTPPANPIFTSIDKQIASLKADFKEKIQTIKSSLLAQKQQLSSFDKGVQSSLKLIPQQDREYEALLRIQVTKENIYKFLLEKREQVALRYASSISDSEVVDDAHAGKVKWPIPAIVYAIALIVGIFAAAAILFIRESLNDLITNRKQIEDKTEVPIIGELAYQDSDKQIVVTEGRSGFAIGEQFRVLRTNLFYLHGNNDKGRVTLFTSSVSGEGKSFVSSNLAVTLAYTTKKVVILEMDLRKPKISVNFGLAADYLGISNYLAGQTTDIDELIRPSGIPCLDVISCGAILPNPSELLEMQTLDTLINELKLRYDEIIIDSPPIHLVTDAFIISRLADTTLYVIRQGYTHKYELDFVKEVSDTNRFPKFALVFNGVKAGASGYGGYGYGYNYTYGNSYYNSYASKSKKTFLSVMKGILIRF